jgi:endonuclease/exonuclease/phosphatase (EEP) superfamily protein YafD
MVETKKLAALFLGLLLLLVTVAVGSSAWGLGYRSERLSHFQIQYWVGAMLLLVLLAASKHKPSLWVGLVCMAVLSVNLLTWYIPASTATTPFLKVFSSNNWVHNQNYPALLELIRKENPDIAMFYEVTVAGQKQLDTLNDILPYSVGKAPGVMIYTKLSLNGTKQTLLGNSQYPNYPGTAIIENLQHLDRTLTLVAAHTTSPDSRQRFSNRNEQLANLAEYLATSSQALIVGGDFNVSMWSHYYRQFIERAALTSARRGFGVIPTWSPARIRSLPELLQPWLSIPIDHIFTRSPKAQVELPAKFELRTISMKAGDFVGSDHLPVIAEIGVVDQ